MKKRKEHAFGKDVYLLGLSKDDEYIWLEAASGGCGLCDLREAVNAARERLIRIKEVVCG